MCRLVTTGAKNTSIRKWGRKAGERCSTTPHTPPFPTLHSFVGFVLVHNTAGATAEASPPAGRCSLLPPCPPSRPALLSTAATARHGSSCSANRLPLLYADTSFQESYTNFTLPRWPPLPTCCSGPKEPKLVPNSNSLLSLPTPNKDR